MSVSLRCPHCGRLNTLRKAGHQTRSGIGLIQQWRCKGDKCGRSTTNPIEVPRDNKGRFLVPNTTTNTTDTINKPVNQT